MKRILFPVEMKKAFIGIHRKFLDETVEALHETGLFQITNVWDSDSDISTYLTEGEVPPIIEACTGSLAQISLIMESLNEVHTDDEGILKKLFFPRAVEKQQVSRRETEEICTEAHEVIGKAWGAVEIKNELSTIRDRIDALHIQEASVSLLEPFGTDLGYLGESELLYVVPVAVDQADTALFHELVRDWPIEELVTNEAVTDGTTVALIATLSQNRTTLDEMLRSSPANLIRLEHYGGEVRDVLDRIHGEIETLNTRKAELFTELAGFRDQYAPSLLTLQEELQIEKERLVARTKLGSTNETVIFEGWVDNDDSARLQALCQRITDGHAFCKFKDPDTSTDNVPIKYGHPFWLEPFQGVTTMFSRPSYDEVDPTVFTGPILIIFFALMLGDAVYGFFILLLGLLLRRGAGRVSRTMRDASAILIVAGVATTVSGVLQGGYMGDFLPRFMGIEPPFVVMNALETPIEFLRIALVIGIIQLNLGLAIAAYQNVRRSRYRELVHDQLSWFIIQPGAAVLLFTFFGWAEYPTAVIYTAIAMCTVGIGLILKNEGALGFFGITGFLGDWLSYARLLALALATGGIAMTVNILTQMVAGSHPITLVLAAIIFVVGQTFNFVLQTLGASIHSLRLQFVEFFGKFYAGGGKEFTPFSAQREVTELDGREQTWY